MNFIFNPARKVDKARFAFTLIFVSAMIAASLLLWACGLGLSGPGGTETTVKVQLGEPILFNQPVPVTITVQTPEDIPGLQISLSGDYPPAVLVEGEKQWTFDAQANRPIQVTSTVRFIEEGYFRVQGYAHDPQLGGMEIDSQLVHITQGGGTLNPPPEPKTPFPLDTLESAYLTEAAIPTEQISTPWNRAIPLFAPNDLLARCGWSASQTPSTQWDDVKMSVTAPEEAPLGTPVQVIVSFDDGRLLEKPGAVRIAWCATDSSVQAAGQREWNFEPQFGTEITRTVTLRFTQAGVFDVLAAGYDPAANVIIQGGIKVRVSAANSLTASPSPPMPVSLSSDSADGGTVSSTEVEVAGGAWHTIITETFEGTWPAPGWTVMDLSNDGYDRYWDDSNYRPHLGNWAAWPADGGVNKLYPALGDHDYPNNMNTRMIYGPFDLSDALTAHAYFYLWWEMESCCDYLALEISHDGVAFEELARWTGAAGWGMQDISYNDHVGDSSVWLAWRFYSNAGITADGPWIDDITISKYVPGDVTVRGTLQYYDRSISQLQLAPARRVKVYLVDSDPKGSDDLLDTTLTDNNGTYQFPPRQNLDVDDTQARRLDPYIVLAAADDSVSHSRATNFMGQAYTWSSLIHMDVPDGTTYINYDILAGDIQRPAMWLYQDLIRAWEYINTNTGTDPGPAAVRWELDKDSGGLCPDTCFWPYFPTNGVFMADKRADSADTLVHELGHQYMYNVMGFWYWSPDNVDDFYQCVLQEHHFFEEKTPLCAWTEGWGDFFALAVNGDACYDWKIGPCDPANSQNLETPTWPIPPDKTPTGDDVEGRVVGALYDLFDSTNEGKDQATFGFAPIWNIVANAPPEYSFHDFWNSWRASGNNQHQAILAIYQNTIDYDTVPLIGNLPDLTVLQNSYWNNALDLWLYSLDLESSDAELSWRITQVSDTRCGVSLNSHYLSIAPQSGWLGQCDVTLLVDDNLKTDTDIFSVHIVPVTSRNYLPLIVQN